MSGSNNDPVRALATLTPGEVKQLAVGVAALARTHGLIDVGALMDEVASKSVEVIDLDQAFRSHSRLDGDEFVKVPNAGKSRLKMIGSLGRLDRTLRVIAEDDASRHRGLAAEMRELTRKRTTEIRDRRSNEADSVVANLLASLASGRFDPMIREESSVRGAISKLRADVAALTAARSAMKPVARKEVTAARRELRTLAEGAVNLMLGQTVKQPDVREVMIAYVGEVAAEATSAREERLKAARAAKAQRALAKAQERAINAAIEAARKSAEVAAALAAAEELTAAQAEAARRAVEAMAAAHALEARAKAADVTPPAPTTSPPAQAPAPGSTNGVVTAPPLPAAQP